MVTAVESMLKSNWSLVWMDNES